MPVVMGKLQGEALLMQLDALAGLRMTVFRDFPYRHEGNRAYKRDYLHTCAQSPGAICVVARGSDAISGASTGIPTTDEDGTFRQPLVAAGWGIRRRFSIMANRSSCRASGVGISPFSTSGSSMPAKPVSAAITRHALRAGIIFNDSD